jgi:hypothetical protein
MQKRREIEIESGPSEKSQKNICDTRWKNLPIVMALTHDAWNSVHSDTFGNRLSATNLGGTCGGEKSCGKAPRQEDGEARHQEDRCEADC